MTLPHGVGPPVMIVLGGLIMSTKRHKPEEIVSKLRQVDVLVGQGHPRIAAIRQVQITE